AEERKLGTIELLLTAPLRDGTLVAAKYGACMVVLLVLLLGTLVHPIALAVRQPLPWQPVAWAYLCRVLLGLSFGACGLFISSLTDNQVVAALATVGVLLLCWVLTWNQAATSPGMLRVVGALSMFDHFEGFARGIIDAGDVTYFLGFNIFFVFLTLRVLE